MVRYGTLGRYGCLGDRREKKEKRKRWKKRRRKEEGKMRKKCINSNRIGLDWNESCSKGNSIRTRKLFWVGFRRILVRVRVQVKGVIHGDCDNRQ